MEETCCTENTCEKTTAEIVLELKREGEAIMREFHKVGDKLAKLGYKMHGNPDQTLYIWKDTRESYGELIQPQPGQQPPGVNGR